MHSIACAVLVVLASVSTTAPRSATGDPAVAAMSEHYARVEVELLARDTSHLNDAQRVRRQALIAYLRDYRSREDFGRQSIDPAARIPQFVDDEGRRCAVAELLHRTGEDRLVELVQVADNDAWVIDLASSEPFEQWLRDNGLTIVEAARIQTPVHTTPGQRKGVGGSHGGPADTAPTETGGVRREAPSAPPPAPPSSPGHSAPRPQSSSAPQSRAAPNTPQSIAQHVSDEATWWMWWEYNKLRYLHATPLSMRWLNATGAESGAERAAALAAQLETMRASYVRSLARSLLHSDAQVRGEAVIAFGRLGAADAVESATRALADPSVLVRNRAILALGSSGDARAYPRLVELARHGRIAQDAANVSAVARPLAIVALALGRGRGFGPATDAEVVALLDTRAGAERDRIALAALAYQILAPSAELEARAVALAADEHESTSVRARAIEALRSSRSPDVISRMQTWLSGSNLELRRSAAIAMGEIDHDLVLPPLLTACELEIEPLTRAFLLVSIGERGGDDAKAFLSEFLRTADGHLRPWAALGLGLAARTDFDADVCELLRSQAQQERNQESIGAYWIALGIAGDVSAVPAIASRLRTTSDPRQRMYLATALALIGDDASRAVLLARARVESSPWVRVAIAQALGHLGRREDAAAIVSTLHGLREPDLQALAAVAMGFHGTTEALSGLSTLLDVPETPNVARAAAINGMAMMLAPHRPLQLARASQHANYTLFESWLDELLQVTL